MTSGYPDWFDVVGLIGQDPDGNLILIQVDSDGRLEIPLKGVHAGELVTVAVDENGYLNAYVLDDESQWGDIIKVGNSELAGRLGSPVTWDWRGKVQAIFDFAQGYQGLATSTIGTGASVTLDPVYWQFGGYSVKLVPGSDSTRYAGIYGNVGITPSGTVGLACCFSVGIAPESFELWAMIRKSEVNYYYRVRYLFADNKVQYRDSDGDWQDIVTYKIVQDAATFYRFKMVVDVDAGTYLRVLLGGSETAETAACQSAAAAGLPDYVCFYAQCFSDEGQNDIIYLDHLILTVAEPAN